MTIKLLAVSVLALGCNADDDGSGGFVHRGSCDALIECAGELQPSVRASFESAYGAGGACWDNGPQQWQACRDACDMALDDLNQAAMLSGSEACGMGGAADGETGDGTGDGTSDDGDPACEFPQSDVCASMVECLSVISPDQNEPVNAAYGPEGSCWCVSPEISDACSQSCAMQLESAQMTFPDVAECQEEEQPCALDPTEPYGPPTNGACLDYQGLPQVAMTQPLGLDGSYCAPACSGLADFCPQHSQTAAQGTCYLIQNDITFCGLRCYVDPTEPGGPQCPCDATCHPNGAPDGEGKMRGLCLWD